MSGISKNILIYFPSNARAVDIQSTVQLFITMGHKVFLLTLVTRGAIHNLCEALGAEVYDTNISSSGGLNFYRKQFAILKKFIRTKKIDVVFAHLQAPGVIAGLVRKLIQFDLYYVRHNTDEHKIDKSTNAILFNHLANRLSPHIIAISDKVADYLVHTDKVPPAKIIRINLGYNFNFYLQNDQLGTAADIRAQYPAKLLLLSMARLVPVKRHRLMFDTIEALVKKGMDIKLLCISDGPLLDELQADIEKRKLQDTIFMLGRKTNVLDYFEAADLFFHLSSTEASNNAVKEAALCNKTSLVCSGAGDFDSYIVHGQNGFLVPMEEPVAASITLLEAIYQHPQQLVQMGKKMHEDVLNNFSIEKTASAYRQLLES